ncbi:effector-binding domain-containing protein [Krasilnikovia cinnamomea]|uniref:Effector-binding domain-containing protein n=1 Tax=Krasilnikovia cinnamomea TaxID=349313 RepID=A0A4Q7ZQ58_9ACTN|nr:GyrI-like domain-containing protein [Krasilnikovia cinnamomea]RZU53242.1 effector-binding domain-containing protein [Krasilnikovia cinnamomea]
MTRYEITARTRQRQTTAVARATLTVAEIGPWLSRTYGQAAACAQAQGAAITGPPFARYHRLGPDRFSIEAGFPVLPPVVAEGGIQPSALPGGSIATTVHLGPYEQMTPAYEALTRWIKEHGGRPAGDPWEVYHSDPATQPDPATWRTEIVQPYMAG